MVNGRTLVKIRQNSTLVRINVKLAILIRVQNQTVVVRIILTEVIIGLHGKFVKIQLAMRAKRSILRIGSARRAKRRESEKSRVGNVV